MKWLVVKVELCKFDMVRNRCSIKRVYLLRTKWCLWLVVKSIGKGKKQY